MLALATVGHDEPEIFASIQGEGPSAGKPALFVRLSFCNLACVWCDTAYTWRWRDEQPHRDGIVYDRYTNQTTLPESDVAGRILALPGERLVVTGGEPLLQAAGVARLLARLKAERPALQVEVETNGTIAPPPALDALVDQYNVSPKLAHSGNAASLALIPERLAEWAADPRAFLKFVVAEPADADEVIALQQRFAIPSDRILLMPEGRDSATLRVRALWLAPLCAAHRFGFSDRLHIHLHGDTRGT